MVNVKLKTNVLLIGSLDDILDDYELSLIALNRSAKTISCYLEILRGYFSFLSQNDLLKLINELGQKELKSYILYLQERNRWPNNKRIKEERKLSPFSIQGHVRAIKAFFSWLHREGLIAENPLVKFPLPKVPQNIIKTLTISNMKLLLDNIDRSIPVQDRLYCILLLFIDIGPRISELVIIEMADINFSQRLIILIGKGQKQRLVPFSNITRRALLKYINSSRPLITDVDSPYLFPAKYGGHVSINSVQQALRRLAKKAGISNCHPHLFRHTFATMFIASNGSASILQEIMGHKSFQTTEKYIHPKAEDLRKHHQLHSPLTEIFKES